MDITIITGLSGAGKSYAMKSMEDLGYYCVDNIPPVLIPQIISLCCNRIDIIEKIALVVDIRGGSFFDDLFSSLDEMDRNEYNYDVLFLEASDEALIKRFKETRRGHPMNPDGSIVDGIKEERERLAEIKKRANRIIDTSSLNIHDLKSSMKSIYADGASGTNLGITVMSFGFKKGIPLDTDMVFDVRFLPNPHYIEELRPHTGNDQVIRDYVMKWPESRAFADRLFNMVDFLVPYYEKEGRHQLIISIGCTGGQHRSVTFANLLYDHLQSKGLRAIVKHREIK